VIAGSRAQRVLLCVCLAIVPIVTATVLMARQRSGGRGGGGGTGAAIGSSQPTRLEILEAGFKLTKDQKKAVKTIVDDAHKRAAPIRGSLSGARTAIAAAIQGHKDQGEIDVAVNDYGRQAAAMTTLEMTTLAQVIQTLVPEQRANTSSIRSAFFLMRGIFLDNRRWDEVPDSRSY
jgi:Spy/CpxP family protein refolding chaperone